jgi:hypothetical protein
VVGTIVHLAEGREGYVVQLGRPPWGLPVVYFHSPASSGEELERVGEEVSIELLTIVRQSVVFQDASRSFMATVAPDTVLLVKALGLESVAMLGWSTVRRTVGVDGHTLEL